MIKPDLSLTMSPNTSVGVFKVSLVISNFVSILTITLKLRKYNLWNCHKASSLFIIIIIWHCILFYVMTKYNLFSVLFHENAKLLS